MLIEALILFLVQLLQPAVVVVMVAVELHQHKVLAALAVVAQMPAAHLETQAIHLQHHHHKEIMVVLQKLMMPMQFILVVAVVEHQLMAQLRLVQPLAQAAVVLLVHIQVHQ
jgi:metal-responsive CopG/Arc/MetJ family transcriptional regulator